jgi:hypothetical protein
VEIEAFDQPAIAAARIAVSGSPRPRFQIAARAKCPLASAGEYADQLDTSKNR